MNKKYLYGFLGLLCIGLVTAGYLVNSFVITSDVLEPFNNIEYTIIGDSSEWDGSTGCDTIGLVWLPIEDRDVDGIMAGESRNMCIRFNNDAEADIKYTISSEVLNSNEAVKTKCESAFPVATITDDALKSSTTTVGYDFKVAGDSPVVSDCQIKISVLRG